MADEYEKAFGLHVRSLRRTRGLTQDELAKRAGVSVDTVRRLEAGSFSPSLKSMRKVAYGLALPLSTLLQSFELADTDSELVEAIRSLSPRSRLIALRLCATLLELERAGL